MRKPAQETIEKKQDAPILIVDKIGIIGQALCDKLAASSMLVFVSSKEALGKTSLGNIIHIPYLKQFPTIPDETYSYIIVVDEEGGIIRQISAKFIEKAEEDKAQLVFAIPLKKTTDEMLKNITSYYKKTKVVIYGDIFGKEVSSNKIIYQSLNFGKIEISGDGLNKDYPVFFDDLIEGILTVVFGLSSSSSVFFLFPKHPPTQLALARLIQKANADIKIDFVDFDKKEKEENVLKSFGQYLLDDSYPLGKRIKELDFQGAGKTGEDKRAFARKDGRNFFHPFQIFLIILLIVLLPFISTVLFYLLGLNFLYNAKKGIDAGNISEAQNAIGLSKTFFTVAQKASAPLRFEVKLIGQGKILTKFFASLKEGENISMGIDYILSAEQSFSDVLLGKSKDPRRDFVNASNNLRTSIILLSEIKADKENLLLANIRTQNIDSLIKLLSNTIDAAPSLFGFDGEKTYLLLFQNNMELRPGGGFIGSYGLLTISSGRITDFSIHDAYDADGQLKGHIEPPYPIRRHLPSAHWYMRDSNFDVSFAKAASSSASFLNIETGKKVDGVIGLDVSFVKNIVALIGPVYVEDYKKEVTKDNLFLLLETHAEKNFFPGSTQKKDFLRSLFQTIIVQLSVKKNIPYLALALTADEAIAQKHLLLAFSNPNLQRLATVNGWSSTLWDEREEGKNIINDFLGINEANLGVNKANLFIGRKVFQEVGINEKGEITEKLKITYKNTNVNGVWPGGGYKNYLRIILPFNASLSSISIDDVEQERVGAITDPLLYEAKNFIAPQKLEVEKREEDGKTIYGFLVTVPTNMEKTISIAYNLSQKIDLEEPLIFYSFLLFKQPGVDNYPFDFSLSYPATFKVKEAEKGVSQKEGKVSFTKTILTDGEIFVKLAKK